METSPDPAAGRPFAAVQSLLAGAGLRPTRQRLQLARILFAQGPRHVTAEMLAQEALGGGLKLPLGTVYNALNAFARAGLLREVAVDGTRTWFDTHTAPHHHFVDAHGRLTDIAPGTVEIARLPAAPPGQVIESVELVVRLRSAP
jgi:Fur family iron response transcriptional regulator